jgi:hypothetical protein
MIKDIHNKMVTNCDNKSIPSITFINRCCSNGRQALLEYLKKKEPMPTIKTFGLFNAIDNGMMDKYKITQEDLLKHSYIIEEDGNKIEVDN